MHKASFPTRETMAQCRKCKDIFSVELVNRRGEVSVEGGASVHQDRNTLTHRPNHCGGAIRIIWMPESGDVFPGVRL